MRLRTKTECSEELVWSLAESSVAFNDTFSHMPAGDIIMALTLRNTFPQNYAWSESVALTQLLMPNFRPTKPSVPNSYSFSKNAFSITEDPESFHSFFLKSAVTLKLVSVTSAAYSYSEQKHRGKNREFPSSFSSEGLC